MTKTEVKMLTLASVISADNEHLPEHTKQEIMSRYDEWKDSPNWAYIFDPIDHKEQRERLIDLFEDYERD